MNDSNSDPTKALQALFLAFPAQERTGNERDLAKVYLMALEGIPDGFIAMACRRFIGGQVPNAGMTFRPTAAEVATEARRLRDKSLKYDQYDRMPKAPARALLTGPTMGRKPFTPYPKLWDALAGEPDLLKALQAMTFDGMTDISKTMAVEGIDAAKDKLRRMASMPARQKASAA